MSHKLAGELLPNDEFEFIPEPGTPLHKYPEPGIRRVTAPGDNSRDVYYRRFNEAGEELGVHHIPHYLMVNVTKKENKNANP